MDVGLTDCGWRTCSGRSFPAVLGQVEHDAVGIAIFLLGIHPGRARRFAHMNATMIHDAFADLFRIVDLKTYVVNTEPVLVVTGLALVKKLKSGPGLEELDL